MTIYADVCEPLQTPTFERKSYFFALITALERFLRAFLIKEKSEVGEYIHEYIASVDRNTRRKTKRVHTDNAAEFVALRKRLSKIGVELAKSTAYSPQSNELSERTNLWSMDKTRTMLKGAGAEKRF